MVCNCSRHQCLTRRSVRVVLYLLADLGDLVLIWQCGEHLMGGSSAQMKDWFAILSTNIWWLLTPYPTGSLYACKVLGHPHCVNRFTSLEEGWVNFCPVVASMGSDIARPAASASSCPNALVYTCWFASLQSTRYSPWPHHTSQFHFMDEVLVKVLPRASDILVSADEVTTMLLVVGAWEWVDIINGIVCCDKSCAMSTLSHKF